MNRKLQTKGFVSCSSPSKEAKNVSENITFFLQIKIILNYYPFCHYCVPMDAQKLIGKFGTAI